MSQISKCPQCNSSNIKEEGKNSYHCMDCGAKFYLGEPINQQSQSQNDVNDFLKKLSNPTKGMKMLLIGIICFIVGLCIDPNFIIRPVMLFAGLALIAIGCVILTKEKKGQ